MFNQEIIEKAKLHAKKEFPKEAVGFVVGDKYVPLENIAENPCDTFQVKGEEWLRHGKVEGVIHSHPKGEAYPSAMDMSHQIETAVPWGIIVCDSERATNPIWFGEHVLDLPLTGEKRPFRHGVTDCYSLIRAGYKQLYGIHLLEFPRDWEWWMHDENLYLEGFETTGFYEISEHDVRPGDVFLACIGSRTIQDKGIPNHGGIYLGGTGDVILHHLASKDPVDFTRLASEDYGLRWLKYVKKWIRHKDLKS